MSDEEETRIAKQAELPFEAGGHDMAPIAPHAPLAHLAPWLDAIRNTTKPIVVICDDAYNGFVYENDRITRSPFHELADADPARVLPIKVDGATKELCFFGGRVGFVTFGVSGIFVFGFRLV